MSLKSLEKFSTVLDFLARVTRPRSHVAGSESDRAGFDTNDRNQTLKEKY